MLKILQITLTLVLVAVLLSDPISQAQASPMMMAASAPVLVKDINPGGDGVGTSGQLLINGVWYFGATDGIHGLELWGSDGTEAGTVMVKDIKSGSAGSGSMRLFSVNGVLYFFADDDASGTELWKSNGTEAGTVMVKDINPGVASSQLYIFGTLNDILFFIVYDGLRTGLWKSNGTEAGTTMVKEISAGYSDWRQYWNIIAINNVLFFSADDGVHGGELWRTDGTEVGTFMVEDINPGNFGSEIMSFFEFNGILFFSADDGVHGGELWRSDGTEAGTFMVKDITTDGSSFYIDSNFYWRFSPLYENDQFYFRAGDAVWKSDGTNIGTTKIKILGYQGVYGQGAVSFIYVNGVTYFTHEGILWKTNGTEEGTVVVKDFHCNCINLLNINETLYLILSDFADQYWTELWKSDGTEPGTVLIKSIQGSAGHMEYFQNENHIFYFSTSLWGHNIFSLWRSDGTEAGTLPVLSYQSFQNGSAPEVWGAVGNTLYLRGHDDSYGLELWKIPVAWSSFADVLLNHWALPYIESIYDAGITGGCSTSPLMYCPESDVTRAQMAVFLERGLHGSGFVPSDVAPTFGDTSGNWAEDWIEALKIDGITAGCGNGNYCPDAIVTRAQMAVFLLRAKHGASYVPPASGGNVFTDVPGDYWAANWIEQLAVEGITSGCSTGLYCPDAPVTRAQMAVFLQRTFSLSLP